jgi:hypothetical protein
MAVVAAGFVDFEITWRGDVYSGAPQSSSAAKNGTLGVNFSARARPARSESWQTHWLPCSVIQGSTARLRLTARQYLSWRWSVAGN